MYSNRKQKTQRGRGTNSLSVASHEPQGASNNLLTEMNVQIHNIASALMGYQSGPALGPSPPRPEFSPITAHGALPPTAPAQSATQLQRQYPPTEQLRHEVTSGAVEPTQPTQDIRSSQVQQEHPLLQHTMNVTPPTIVNVVQPAHGSCPVWSGGSPVDSPEVVGYVQFMAQDHTSTIPDGSEIQKVLDTIDHSISNASILLDQNTTPYRPKPRYARAFFAEAKRDPQLLGLYKMIYAGSLGSDKDGDAWVERAHELEGRGLVAYNLLRALIGAAITKSVFTASLESCWEDHKSHLTHLVSILEGVFTEQGNPRYSP